MKHILVFLAIVGLAANTARGDAVEGLAALAASHEHFSPTHCNQILRFYRELPEVFHAELWRTFGTRRRCAKRVFKLEKPVTVQWYMSNEVCRRKNNCYSHELAPKLSVAEFNHAIIKRKRPFKRARKIARKALAFCDRNRKPSDRCLFAIGLESQYNEAAARALVKMSKAVGWPADSIVHNPVNVALYQGFAGARYLEHHGIRRVHFAPKERAIVSLDGIDPSFCNRGRPGLADTVSFQELRKWRDFYKNRASYLAYWCSVHQGISGDSAHSPNPRHRSPRVDPGDIDHLLALTSS